MRNLKREIKKIICSLLTVAMLCTSTGFVVFAEEAQEEENMAEVVPVEAEAPVEDPYEEGGGGEETEEKAENPSEEDEASEEHVDAENVDNMEDVPAEENPLEENEKEEAVEETKSLKTTREVSEEGIIASGEYKENGNDLIWVIDANGKLTVEGTGDFSDDSNRTPWYDQRESIKFAEINVVGMNNASCMFQGCSNLTSLDVSSFDTSNVTDMGGMFSGCSGLTSLDVSSFDTSNVTDMSSMFSGCSGLTSLDVSNFATSNVTRMESMFSDCSSLTSLDLSNFDTMNVTSWISSMFSGCSSLTSLDLSSFSTRKVTSMSSMFLGCSGLASLNLSSFDTSNVTDMSSMFSGCSNLTSLDLSNFDTSNVTDMSSMFSGCSGLTSLDVSSFDTSNVTRMSSMFSGCSGLISLDLSSFDTSNVTDMSYMFYGCSGLISLDLSSFDTFNATKMGGMFSGCNKLQTMHTPYNLYLFVDLPSGTWYQPNGTAITKLPRYLECSILIKKNEVPIAASIKAVKTKTEYVWWETIDVDDLTVMCCNVDGVEWQLEAGEYTTNVNEIDMTTGGIKTLVITYGELTATVELTVTKSGIIASGEYKENGNDIIWVIDADGKLTVEGTGNFSQGFRAPWYDKRTYIKSAEVDVTGMSRASDMFLECSNLTSVDLSGFDTSNVTDMSSMFSGCSNLTSLDLSNFDTSNVTRMSSMFSGCGGLASLDLSNFDTSSATNMYSMFSGCSGLASLDVSNFDTSSVTNMYSMFSSCNGLTSLDVSNFDTSNVTDMRVMFSGCSDLTSLDVSNFDTSNVTNMYSMFSGCSGLTSLDVSNFDTSNVTDMWHMFEGCSGLTSLDVHNFDTSNVIRMDSIFMDCSGLTSLDVSNFDTSNVTDMPYIFRGCSGLTSLDVSNFDTSNVTDMWHMFEGCSGLESLDVSNFDTSNVIDMRVMFSGCSGLTSLDVSNFDTSNVTHMGGMFSGCSSLTSLDVSNFNTSNVTWIADMFSGCSGLTSLDVSSLRTIKVWSMNSMFSGCSGLTSLDVSGFITSNVTDMNGMFSGCNGLTSLDLSNFNTKNVIDMNGMFSGCNGLTSLDLSNFNTKDAIHMNDMFDGCNRLQTIYTPYNLTLFVALPSGTWYQPDGTRITELPRNLDRSILIKKNEISVVPATIKATITKISYICGDTINIDDLTVTYYGSDGTARELAIGDYTTNVNEIDMSTEGTKTLVITYGELTTVVELTVTGNGIGQNEFVSVPTASPESGRQLTIGSKVTLTCETEGAEIYYTTAANRKELTNPTKESLRYTKPITIDRDTYIRAVAIKVSGYSKFINLHYTVADIENKVLKPYAAPEQGTVETGTKVELKCDTPDAEIYYAIGGNADMLGAVPVDDDHKYTEPIEITEDMAIKAIAVKDGMEDSDFSVFVYRINVALDVPTAYPAAGIIDRGSYISLNADSNVNIYYTMDQSDPVTSSSAKLYESRIRVDGDSGSTIVVKAAAEKKGNYSETVTFTYTVSESTVKGLQVMLAGGEEFTYTGSAITPAVIVTNNGEELVEGEDYTVRYSNNIKAADKNAAKAPKITVTGKGNLTKSRNITFTIKPKYIGDEEEVVGGNIVVVSGKTASPVLFYNGVKLTAKDFANPNSKKKYNQDATITITGKGNFEGTRDIDVRVVDKKNMKKFTVVIDSKALKREPLIYDGEEKTMDGYFEVYDAADKSRPLEEYSDYAVIYPKNNINAGKVKFTVVGLGEYYGTVAKSYTIKPRVIKTEADGDMDVNVNNGDEYPFTSGGVTIPDLTVTCDGDVLVSGKDYKVTYSNNKKICSNSKAKCTISFKGNYKGSKSLVRNFNITAVAMDDVDKINESVSVAVADMVYTGKPGAYKSIPYVTVNGVLLKSSDYKVSYYKDVDREQMIDGKNASVDLTDRDKQTVYMKIEGKGNYEGILTAEYNVYKLTENAIDLSKAKVTFVGGNKAEYTGEGVNPDIEIKYKSGKEWKTLSADDIGTYVTVTYINNVNKGKATVMINGNGDRYVGSKTAIFNIVAKSMK